MAKKIIIEHPFFEDYAKAYQSHIGKTLDTEAYQQLKESVCGLFPQEILKIKWPAWEIGLPRPEGLVPKESLELWHQHSMVLLSDFFKRVENGVLYCDYSAVLEKHREGVEGRIGKSSGLHFNLESAYWTFNIKFNKWIERNKMVYNCTLVCNLEEMLSRFDSYLRQAFFPTPGPYDIGPKERKKLQDQMLHDFAPTLRKELMKEIWG